MSSYVRAIVLGSMLGFYLGQKGLQFPVLYNTVSRLQYEKRAQYRRSSNDIFGTIVIDLGIFNELRNDIQKVMFNIFGKMAQNTSGRY